MQTIKVDKATLIAILETNRTEHRGLFLEAQKRYREAIIVVLDQQLAVARNGEHVNVRRIVQITCPTDHTDDYDLVIGMLKLDINHTVDLSAQEYAQYVDDDWGWMGTFASEVSSYGISNAKISKWSSE
jgi:hypothetical protein